jgi:hypothetical protein
VSKPDPFLYQKALEVKLPDAWRRAAAVFDETNVCVVRGVGAAAGVGRACGLVDADRRAGEDRPGGDEGPSRPVRTRLES